MPLIAAAKGVELAGVVARAPATIARVEADLPGVPVFSSLTATMAAGGFDAVTGTTPPETRRALVPEAIDAGLHVIADKPFAPTAEAGDKLDAAATAKGVVLGVYHNRRFDADFQTLRKVVTDGRLGRIWRVHSRMDQDSPETLEAGPTGGLLRNLGSDVVDQMLWLPGPAVSIDPQPDLVDLPADLPDASVTITLRHDNGADAHISASEIEHFAECELRTHGDPGRCAPYGTDARAQGILARRPADDRAAWGYEDEAQTGRFRTASGDERVRSERGALSRR